MLEMKDATVKPKRMRGDWRDKLPKKPWITAILAVLLVYFLLFIGQPLAEGAWCLPNDYMGYYSAGQIMNAEEPSLVYDFDLLKEYQANLYQACGFDGSDLEPLAMLYLPVFFLPFQLFAIIDIQSASFYGSY